MAKVKMNLYGFYKLRSAPGVIADLERRAARVKAAAGGDHDTSSQQGEKKPYGRWRTTVVAWSYADKKANAQSNTLLRALDAGR